METVPLESPDLTLGLAILFISILCVAFFSSSEASLISVSKIRIQFLADQGNRAAKAVQRVVDKHDKLFATILLTENMFIILASSIGTAIAVSILGHEGVIISTLAMTFIIVIFGEITPKTYAAAHSEKMSLLVARPIEIVIRVLSPLVYFFTLVTNAILSLVSRGPKGHSPFVTEEELRMLIDKSGQDGTVEEAERAMLQNVFRFGERQVREVMTPRTEIFAIDKSETVGDFLSLFEESSRSRFPVYEESIDNITGILSIKDVLLSYARNGTTRETPIEPLVRSAYFVPETKRVDELFTEMQSERISMAIIIDEFGGTAGLVTLEKLVEEIVGEMDDEMSSNDGEEVESIDEKNYKIDAGMRIDEINEELGLNLPRGEYETVAGFVLDHLGRIPKEGDQLRHDGIRLMVSEMQGVKIERILVTKG